MAKLENTRPTYLHENNLYCILARSCRLGETMWAGQLLTITFDPLTLERTLAAILFHSAARPLYVTVFLRE